MANQDFTTGTEQNILDWFFTAGAAPTRPSAWWVGLFSVLPTANAGTGGTEHTEAGYGRQQVTLTRTNQTMNPSAAFTFGPATEDWAQTVGFGFFSAETNGTLYAFKALTTARTFYDGDSGTYATSDLAITLD